MRRSASLFGLLGLLFLAFGFVGHRVRSAPSDRSVRPPEPRPRASGSAGRSTSRSASRTSAASSASAPPATAPARRSTRSSSSRSSIGLQLPGRAPPHRWDVTEAGVYTLSPQSKKVVEALQGQARRSPPSSRAASTRSSRRCSTSYRYAAPAHVEDAPGRPRQGAGLGRADEDHHGAERAPPVRQGEPSSSRSPPRRRSPTASSASRGRPRRSSTSPRATARPTSTDAAGSQGLRQPRSWPSSRRTTRSRRCSCRRWRQIPDDASVVVLAGPDRPLTDHADRRPRRLPEARRPPVRCWSARARATARSSRASLATGASSSATTSSSTGRSACSRARGSASCRSRKTYGTHPITQNFRDFTVYPADADGRAGRRGQEGPPGHGAGEDERVELGRDQRRRACSRSGRRQPRRRRIARVRVVGRRRRHGQAEGDGDHAAPRASRRRGAPGRLRHADVRRQPAARAVAAERRPLPERRRLARRPGGAGLHPQPQRPRVARRADAGARPPASSTSPC